MNAAEYTVGLAVGRGTGAEVAEVFEEVLAALARRHGRTVTVARSPRTYHSYVSLKRQHPYGTGDIRRLTREDADHYEQFVRTQAAAGTRAVFRTAINAQTLYLVRHRLHAVKVDALDAAGARMLLVRDQAQGFYTGENEHRAESVRRTTEFSRATTHKVLAYALRRAWQEWPGEGPAALVMAYKFHLLDGVLDTWAQEFAERHGVEVRVFQPDTVNRNLITHGPADRTVLVAGNEWADIMHVVLLDRFGAGRQEEHCTRNVHLHADVEGFTEYQTVHGSADDLEGRNLVNPLATVRAAAAVAEQHAGCPGAVAAAESALARVREEGIGTPDLGGRHSTTEDVAAFLAALEPGGSGGTDGEAAGGGGGAASDAGALSGQEPSGDAASVPRPRVGPAARPYGPEPDGPPPRPYGPVPRPPAPAP
jgi:isocitrate/isopropylmalate dehydrogenase